MASFDWFHNVGPGPEVTDDYIASNWCCLVSSILILIHSAYVNGRVKHKIRTLVEICALGGLFAAIFELIYSSNPEDEVIAGTLPQLLSQGICTIFIQIPDNLIFLYAYHALSTKTRSSRYLTTVELALSGTYITFILVLPFLLPVTLFPIVFDETTDDYNSRIGDPLLAANCFGYIAYNVTFTFLFARILYKIYIDPHVVFPRIAGDICIRCLIHCCISTAAILQYYFNIKNDVSSAGPIYNVLIMCGLHFVFNSKRYKGKRLRDIVVKVHPLPQAVADLSSSYLHRVFNMDQSVDVSPVAPGSVLQRGHRNDV